MTNEPQLLLTDYTVYLEDKGSHAISHVTAKTPFDAERKAISEVLRVWRITMKPVLIFKGWHFDVSLEARADYRNEIMRNMIVEKIEF